jgi:Cu(I)/Ag(I) efflux system membrane fusion protein
MITPPGDDPTSTGSHHVPAGLRIMAIVRWGLVVFMAVVALGAGLMYFGVSLRGDRGVAGAPDQLFYCPMHPQIVQDHPGACPICNMTLVPKPPKAVPSPVQSPQQNTANASGAQQHPSPGKFYCPMHPQVTSDDPSATCQLCGGMKLVPRPADAATGSAAVPGLVPVEIPLDRVQRIGVRTEKVRRRSLAGDLRTVGVVEASERGLASISPRFAGWIEELRVAETGQKVKRGQTLATIYSPEVLQAQQELLTALGWSTGAAAAGASLPHHGETAPLQGLVADARHRLELLGISPQEIEDIVQTRKPHRAIAIRSPVEGHVIARNAVAGMSVSPGTPLFEIADLSSVWVIAEVYESDLKRVRIGQHARFEPSASPGEVFEGRVSFVAPVLDAGSRTLRVRLEFRNRPGPAGLKLRPGMYGNVSLDLPATTGLTVPAEAVVDTGDLQYVFIAREGGRYEPRRVKVGVRLDDAMELVEGIAEGETVVTTANFLIDSESRLRAAVEGSSTAVRAADSQPKR